MKRILLIEDDLSLINGLSFAVKKQGYDLELPHNL
jgi:DNA-binding response OmpR family regulator